MLRLFVLLAVTCVAFGNKKETCESLFCAEGQECVERKSGPTCECIEKCNSDWEPVCGNNGTHMITYDNECHYARASCLLEGRADKRITFVAASTCDEVREKEKYTTKKIEMDSSKPKPVVCKEKDRNNLRQSIISWITNRLESKSDRMSYKGLLKKYFTMLDVDKDGKVGPMEFMKLIEDDMTITEILSEDAYSNPILRGLCLNELIAITDVNANYQLEFGEFHKCLDPEYYPPEEHCELNGMIYKDGDEVPLECNTCQCACGHWVCTQLNCKDNNSKSML